MFDPEEQKLYLCYSCDAEFSIDPVTDEEEPEFCPYCGAGLVDEDEDQYDEEDK